MDEIIRSMIQVIPEFLNASSEMSAEEYRYVSIYSYLVVIGSSYLIKKTRVGYIMRNLLFFSITSIQVGIILCGGLGVISEDSQIYLLHLTLFTSILVNVVGNYPFGLFKIVVILVCLTFCWSLPFL